MSTSTVRSAPASTYRLQVSPDLPLESVAGLVPYLRRLGVDWLYLSPLLEAEPGSDHGYDVVDPTRLDAARGGAEGLDAVARAAHEAGMGVLVDIVPNHVGVATPQANPAWWDVLTHGPEAAHAAWFDVDWAAGGGSLLIPVLGDGPDGDADAELNRLVVDEGRLRYWDNVYPLAPGSLEAAEAETGLRAAEVFAEADPAKEPTAEQARLARAVHERQHYRLVGWRRGDAELNYRRFFTVTTLAGVRVDEPEVFDAVHAEPARWVREGLVDGLRVDHPDGLADPAGYARRLRSHVLPEGYLVVEKILEPGEALPADWPVDGTTGYDALGEVERVFMHPDAAGDAAEDARRRREWDEAVVRAKHDVATGSLAAETARLVREVRAVHALGAHPDEDVAAAFAAVLARLPVYRTYLPVGLAVLEGALADAAEAEPGLADVLGDLRPELTDPDSPVARRFQQTSGMVMAKGVEDRSFYRYTRWANLNEVGGDPSHVALSLADFHAAQQARQAAWPTAMTTLSTHDTKRGEDVRARIAVLAEEPDRWAAELAELRRLHPLGHPDAERLLWESIVGVWPTDGTAPGEERILGFLQKASREAALATTWTDQDPEFEARLAALAAAVTSPEGPARGVLQAVADRIAEPGLVVQLGHKLVQLAAPGVPDVYQGTEVPFPILVDPDNRRPVDFAARADLLDRLDAGHTPGLDWPVRLAAAGGWGETVLTVPAGRWEDAVTGHPVHPDARGAVRLDELLSTLPVALLVPAHAPSDRRERTAP